MFDYVMPLMHIHRPIGNSWTWKAFKIPREISLELDLGVRTDFEMQVDQVWLYLQSHHQIGIMTLSGAYELTSLIHRL